MLLGLEASEEIDQERVPDAVHCLEDPLLTHQTVEQNAASHCHGGKLAHMKHLIRLSKMQELHKQPSESPITVIAGLSHRWHFVLKPIMQYHNYAGFSLLVRKEN